MTDSRQQRFQTALKAFQAQEFARAAQLFEELLEEDRQDDQCWFHLAGAQGLSGQMAAAADSCRQALRVNPEFAPAHFRLANCLDELGDHQAALASFDHALALQPDYVQAWNNRGLCLVAMHRAEEAEQSYRRALEFDARNADVQTNLGIALVRQDRIHEAIECFQSALALNPVHVEAGWSLGLCLLTQDHYHEGWPYYEWRWQRHKKVRQFSGERWQDQSLQGKRILIWHEQGFGDILQFCRHLPLLKQNGAQQVWLLVQPSMNALMQGLPGIDGVIADVESPELPPFDLHCPIASLPGQFDITLQQLPGEPFPYLNWSVEEPLPQRRADKPAIGIVWQGSLSQVNDLRPCPLDLFLQHMSTDDFDIFSLQKERSDAQVSQLKQARVIDLSDTLKDFAATANWLLQLDLFITIDTSVAHLAGAMGIPTWLLLPFAPDWRWGRERVDCPWYPGLRLYRQPAPGDWQPVWRQINRDLDQWQRHYHGQ